MEKFKVNKKFVDLLELDTNDCCANEDNTIFELGTYSYDYCYYTLLGMSAEDFQNELDTNAYYTLYVYNKGNKIYAYVENYNYEIVKEVQLTGWYVRKIKKIFKQVKKEWLKGE